MRYVLDRGGRTLYRLTRLYGTTEYVKSASVAEVCGSDALPAQAHADPRRRRYPCHTKAATWASAALFVENGDNDAETRQRILEFARLHAIERDVQKVWSARERPASPPARKQDFLFKDGGTLRCPIRNASELQRAVDYLRQHRDQLPFIQRLKAARTILRRADELRRDLGEMREELEKTAGLGCGSSLGCRRLLHGRRTILLRDHGATAFADRLSKLAQVVEQRPRDATRLDFRLLTAIAVDEVDRHFDLHRKHPGLERLEDALFPITMSKLAAARAELCSLQTGNTYHLDDLCCVPVSTVRAVLGDDVADALTQDGLHVDEGLAASVLPTLPRGDAEAYEKLIASALGDPEEKKDDDRADKRLDRHEVNLVLVSPPGEQVGWSDADLLDLLDALHQRQGGSDDQSTTDGDSPRK